MWWCMEHTSSPEWDDWGRMSGRWHDVGLPLCTVVALARMASGSGRYSRRGSLAGRRFGASIFVSAVISESRGLMTWNASCRGMGGRSMTRIQMSRVAGATCDGFPKPDS